MAAWLRASASVFQADQQLGPIQAGVISIAKVSFRRAVTNVAFAALANHMVTG